MVWGFCVYFVYMIPLETDVLRKHRFQKPILHVPVFCLDATKTGQSDAQTSLVSFLKFKCIYLKRGLFCLN